MPADGDGDRSASDADPAVAAKVRGIYATALTHRLREAGHTVVQPSDPIADRFEDPFPDGPPTVEIADTHRRQGLTLTGDQEAVSTLVSELRDVAIDVLDWPADAPQAAIYDGVVTDTLGSGAVVDLGPGGEGFLPFDAVDRRIDGGDVVRVQVREPAPPWVDRRPELAAGIRVPGSLADLERGHDAAVVGGPSGEAGRELAGLLDFLAVEIPERWAVRWDPAAAEADMATLESALGEAVDAAADLEAALGDLPESSPPEEEDAVPAEHAPANQASTEQAPTEQAPTEQAPTEHATPRATHFVWFGREARFAFDTHRAGVVPTMAGHHRIKAGDRRASDAVDFAEAVFEPDPEDAPGNDTGSNTDARFPFGAVADQFGPAEGDTIRLAHGKPAGHVITLGRATVTDRDVAAGRLTVERELSAGGSLDALEVPIEDGDVAVTTLTEGAWWYPTVYRDADGERKGTYVNVCTPVEVFPDRARYVDLHVDVIKHRDGTVERVDDHELDAAVDDGSVPPALAEKAREVASALEDSI